MTLYVDNRMLGAMFCSGVIMAGKANVKIVLGKDENIEKALRRFKKLCEKVGIKKEIKDRQHFEKPGEVRRKEIRKSERNRRKAERKTTDDQRHSKNPRPEKKTEFKNYDN